jgi:hypothetical protein
MVEEASSAAADGPTEGASSDPPAAESNDLPDDATAEPPSPPVPAAEARRNVTEPKEQLDEDSLADVSTPGGADQTLQRLLTFHPFMRFFRWLADRQFPGSHLPETRVRRLREESKHLYWTCVTLDMLVTALAVLLLLAAALAVLYKTIWLGA